MTGREKNLRSATELGAVLSMAGHDLRNFLNVIKAAAYNIRTKTSDRTDLSGHMDNLEQNVAEAEELLKCIAGFAMSRQVSCAEQVDIRDVISDAVRMTGTSGDGVSVEYHMDLERVDPAKGFVRGNRALFSELFACLLKNSLEALHGRGEGAIHIRTVVDPENMVCGIEVADNGPGMTAEDIKKLRNERFFSSKGPCSGLGLTVCREIVSAHGGKISFSSEEGAGFKVDIDLPWVTRESR